ncbi:serine/threonine-protein kinase PknK [Anaerolineae bacterium]|nr:serine/threonine-protein kinase PknK [Anaerolineae bacterium]
MPTPILATKLYIPPPRPKIVLRPRLIEQMNEGLRSGCKLTLISASAGFGKTTLVSEWLAGCERLEPKVRVAWLSLDEGDNDPTHFMIYFVAALQTIAQCKVEGVAAKLGEGVLGALQSPQPPSIESILTTLLNEITTIPDNFIFVLDDYHIIDSKPVDNAITFLLEHLPPQMHLVITTREDPQFPLARLRARGQLTELRAADLRFTPTEAAEFLNQAMSLQLSAEDIAALEARTEGWITGLQLAALALQGSLSMQGRPDTSRFIQSFTGSHRFVLDYLVEEVLQRQPEHIRSFLLQTAILERLSGSLCDAVTGQKDGRGILETLERGNLFIIPLDDQRQWYRYHHLFTEVLLAHALEEQPGQIPLLHKRASTWYEQNNLPAEAIRHALAARDFERAAGLIEKTYPAMDTSFQSAAWLGWAKKLPEDVIRVRPVLSTQMAMSFIDAGEPESSESYLQDAERCLNGSSSEMVVADEAQFRTLPAMIALARSYHASVQGDIGGTVKYAELALELSPEKDTLSHALAAVTLGMAYWSRGDLGGAQRALSVWINYCQKVGKIIFAIASGGYLAEIIVAQGRLREAERTYKQSIQLASMHDQSVRHVTSNLYLGLGLLYHEQGDQQSAAQHLHKSGELGEQALIDWPYRWRLAQARLKEAEGDLETALDLLDEARGLYVRTTVPDFYPIDALKARVYLRQGRLSEALAWARERGLSVDDNLSYLGEFEHITLARVLIAQYKNDPAAGSIHEAIDLLERLLKATEEGGRMGSVIEILILQSLAHEAQDNIPLALASMERALALAEPEGYVRIFVDEGEPMRLLIEKQSRSQDKTFLGYVDKLLAAFARPTAIPQPKTLAPALRSGPFGSAGVNNLQSTISEPLSERELQVLRLLGTELSGPEIAHELVVSLNTLRTHTKSIFNKLGVNNRRAAVRRAEELNLF